MQARRTDRSRNRDLRRFGRDRDQRGFVAMVGFNSVVSVPSEAKSLIVLATTFLLSMALAAMGLESGIAKLRTKGLRPRLLGLAAFPFIASFSLMRVKLTM